MDNKVTHTIDLDVGCEEKGVRHTRVTFGKLLTGGMMMALDEDPQSDIPTQHQLLIVRAQITEFGSLPIPVPLTTLLSLDDIDLDDLTVAANEFTSKCLDGRKSEFVSESEVKLAVGFERNGLVYNRVRFGGRATGHDRVAADKKGYKGLRRECYLIGREIAELSTEDGAHSIEGPIEVQVFEQLAAADIITLRAGAALWGGFFRRSKRVVQGAGEKRDDLGGKDGLESQ